MDDILAFLRARLDEDEAAARAATPGPWHLPTERWMAGIPQVESGSTPVARYRKVYDDGEGMPLELGDADHIIRHDPARVLREVEAKRRIVEHNTKLHGYADPAKDPSQAYVLAAGASDYTLRILTAVYADHPDYRDEWRP